MRMVDLTYFIGRPFVDVLPLTGEDDGLWAISLDGGSLITNKDESKPVPDKNTLVGTQFIRPIYSELDTRLQFGVKDAVLQEVILSPTLYTISDPDFTSDGEIYPQMTPDPLTGVAPDPSDERVVDGPEEAEGDEE
jgi:hypothetical protein